MLPEQMSHTTLARGEYVSAATVQPATLTAQHEQSVWMNARSAGTGSRPSGRSR